ncbi:zinc knuckle-domain-containing protein [Geopyxis carbonaria]|nr:zinc knuckle-domain-containing protein [Geopyxis carbonaria]
MHRYRGPTASASASRATPSTRCQKCLKLGHYTFECKSATQERPYISRPSRTQQLFNPKLQPKLQETALPDQVSLVNKKGVADSILKRKEEEREGRSRKRGRNGSGSPPAGSRRSSSASSFSSYSSISSGRSPSPPAQTGEPAPRARSRRRRSPSYSRSPDHERSVRRKYRDSPSPARRGRRLSPTDFSRRTRSRSPPRRLSGTKRVPGSPLRRENYNDNGMRAPPRRPSPPRERSLSPFTRRKLITEAMQR